MTKPSENELAELLELARGGGQDAFGQLVSRFEGVIMKTALAMTGHYDQAQDAAQEVFLSFFRSLDRIDAQRGVQAWLRKVTVHTCLTLLQRRGRIEDRERPGQPDLHPSVNTHSPMEGELTSLLAELSPRERAAFVLVYQYGYQTAEAGVVLGIAPGTVKSLCFRARHKLREAMQKQGGL